jgi:Ca2+:H+ antiporter
VLTANGGGHQDEIRIVQASLLGSILANLLLILGMCFVLGGLRFREQVSRAPWPHSVAVFILTSTLSDLQ